VELYNRDEEGIHAKEGEGVSIIKGEERRGAWAHQRTIEKRVY